MRSANFSKPAIGSSTIHMVAVNSTTEAIGANVSKMCDPCAKCEWEFLVLVRNTVSVTK